MKCSICKDLEIMKFATKQNPISNYWRCLNCGFVSRAFEERLTSDLELKRYELHRNQDPHGHRKFLEPVLELVQSFKDAQILDFGSGPTPVLRNMLNEIGIACEIYDAYFHPEWPKQQFDLITCTEVIEHFTKPDEVLTSLARLLHKNGKLIVMTSLVDNCSDFETWSYRRDPTHVSLFSLNSFSYFGNFGLKFEKQISSNIFLFNAL